MYVRPPTVWLLQEPRGIAVDLEDARQFGVVKPVLPASFHPQQAPGPALFQLMQAFRDYQPGDHLLYAPSDPLVPLLAGLALHATGATREPLRWLRWDRRRAEGGGRAPGGRDAPGHYIPVFVDARRALGFSTTGSVPETEET